jgi:Mce-associated membrane protein
MSEQTRASALERVLVGALAVAVLLAAAVLVRLLVAGDTAALPEGTTPIVAGASITSAGAKQEAMVAAAGATRKVLSYTAETLDADIEAARATLAGDMLGRYADTMERIREQTEENGTAVEATVVARSIISATEHDAKVLLFVNQSTTGRQLEEPRVERNRVVVTLHRDEAGWLVTALDAI